MYRSAAQTGERKQASRGAQTITPLTIKQFSEGDDHDGKLHVDNKEIGSLTVVGYVINAEISSTNNKYTITDGTGQIDVVHYKGDIGAESDMMGSDRHISDGMYVAVYGTVKVGKTITANHVVPITDHNQIVAHMLDAIATHNRNTKGMYLIPYYYINPYATTAHDYGQMIK